MLTASRIHADRVAAAQVLAVKQGSKLWGQTDPRNIASSWRVNQRQLVAALTAVQLDVATSASEYGADVLAEQGTYSAPQAFVDPRGFAGIAPDGRTLEGLLWTPVVTSKAAIGNGIPVSEAMERGQRGLSQILRTVVADTGRSAAQADVATREHVGYTRVVVGESCPDCLILAGRFYMWNTGFQRHPSCFPAGTVVSGPELEGATRRWYEGELVILTTASGQKLSLTSNHPVLTRRGWIPAHFLDEGDDVFRSTDSKGALPLVVPDHNQMPSLIEDIWSTFRVNGFDRVPTSPEDFHGDGINGEVDIVRPYSSLRDWGTSAFFKHFKHQHFPIGLSGIPPFNFEGMSELGDLWRGSQTRSTISGSGLLFPFTGSHVQIASNPSFGSPAHTDAIGSEFFTDSLSGNFISLREGIFGSAGFVGVDDIFRRERSLVPVRWDAPAAEFSVETSAGYRERGNDLLNRLSGHVEADRLVKVERIDWSGHVYSVTSSEGWHSANNLIVSNCDCQHVPTTKNLAENQFTDPYAHFESMSAEEQDEFWGEADAKAIRDGGDIYQVYNSRRGISKDGLTTLEGTTRRGHMGGMDRRLTPDGIYKQAKSRDEALRLLKDNGYLLPGGQQAGGVLRGNEVGFAGYMGRGGTRRGATQAFQEAVRTGRRDPRNVATMTAAERRMFDAQSKWDAVVAGRNPYGGPLTPKVAASVEKDYRRWLRTGGNIF